MIYIRPVSLDELMCDSSALARQVGVEPVLTAGLMDGVRYSMMLSTRNSIETQKYIIVTPTVGPGCGAAVAVASELAAQVMLPGQANKQILCGAAMQVYQTYTQTSPYFCSFQWASIATPNLSL